MSTAARLRALVAALPREAEQEWDWEPMGSSALITSGGPGFIVAKVQGHRGTLGQVAVAKHIAAVASPPVVLALADLLDALADFHEPAVGEPVAYADTGVAIRRLLRARDALDAALNREPPQ